MRRPVLLYSLILVGISFAFPDPTAYLLTSPGQGSLVSGKRSTDDVELTTLLKRGSRGTPSKNPPSSALQRVPSWERLSANQAHPFSPPRRPSDLGQTVGSRSSGRRSDASADNSPARERPQASGGNSRGGHKRPGPPLANPRAMQHRGAAPSGDGAFTGSPGPLHAGSARYLHRGYLGSSPLPAVQRNSEAQPPPHQFARDHRLEAISAMFRAQREMFPEGFPQRGGNPPPPGRPFLHPEILSNAREARNINQMEEVLSGAALRAARQPLRGSAGRGHSEQEKMAGGRDFLAGLRNPPAMGQADGAQQEGGMIGQARGPQPWGASFADLGMPSWEARAGGRAGPGGRRAGIQANAAQGRVHQNVEPQAARGPDRNRRGALGQAVGGRGSPGRGRGAGLAGNAGGQAAGQGAGQAAGQPAWGAMFEPVLQGLQPPPEPPLPHISSASSIHEHYTASKEDS